MRKPAERQTRMRESNSHSLRDIFGRRPDFTVPTLADVAIVRLIGHAGNTVKLSGGGVAAAKFVITYKRPLPHGCPLPYQRS